MLGMTFAVVAIIVIWAATRLIPENYRSFSLAGYFVAGGFFLYSAFNGIFFYAEPGYKYHVRTITGQEKMVSDTGYNSYLFGRVNAWKNAMSVQAVNSGTGRVAAEAENTTMSANLSPQSLVFLDQVDAQVTATARFELPSDEQGFLTMARLYRTPENLLRTELIPAFQETLGATAALLSAEDYFQGGKTEFNNEFQRQMEGGIYIVRRVEERVQLQEGPATGTANASLGTNQEDYGEQYKTVFRVRKILDESGQPQRKSQSFIKFGITVTSARVTGVDPNIEFKKRMALRQQASADRAIAREQRIQEEEQRLLAIAKGEREVAERQAQAKVLQIERTTNAETEKQLAITEAEKLIERAQIDRDRSRVLLEKAQIDAEAVKVAADAEAFAKAAVLEADNALAQKLETELAIQRVWAEAYAKRNVPQYVFGASGGDGGVPTGNDQEARLLQQMLTMEYAKRLEYDRSLQR